MNWISRELGPETYVNLMAQYHPASRVAEIQYPEISRSERTRLSRLDRGADRNSPQKNCCVRMKSTQEAVVDQFQFPQGRWSTTQEATTVGVAFTYASLVNKDRAFAPVDKAVE
jgi:hypothetical protein